MAPSTASMCFRSESLAVYSCISASVSSRDGKVSVTLLSRFSSLPRWIWRLCRSYSAKIYEPLLRICREQLHLYLVTDVHSFLAASQPSLHWRIHNADVSPARLAARHDRVEALAQPIAEKNRRRNLAHLSLDFACCVFPQRAIASDFRQLVIGVGRGSTGEHCLHDSLGDEIRVAPIRRRRMRVILHGETKMTGFLDTSLVEDVLAGTKKFHHGKGQVGEVVGIRRFPLQHEVVQRHWFRLGRQRFSELLRQVDDS